jgi:peptidoglycan LD-endopeptidase LytH
MKRVALVIALGAAALLQGCGREPVVTRVEPPTHSLPDNAQLRPGPGASVPPPQAPVAAAPAPAVNGTGEASVAPLVPPPPAKPLAQVRDPGDALGADLLAQRPLLVPVVGVAPTRLADNFDQSRGSRKHEAIDILAPAGTPIVAVDDGRITKLFTSKPGGLTIYQYDPTGQLAYYYAHLQRYADGVREGMDVKRGTVIGYVGSTGNADAKVPHLHFAVFRLNTPPKWWQGEAVNPYPALARAEPAQQIATR